MTARSVVGIISLGLLVAGGVPFDRTTALIEAAPPPSCPSGLKERTPQQVLTDFRTALAAGDWEAVRCNLDEDAVMISDSGVTNGPDEIVAEFQAISAFFGGTVPTVYSEIVVSVLGGNRYMARQLSFIDTVCVDIPDGTNTFIIKGGQIAALTTHGFFVFSCLHSTCHRPKRRNRHDYAAHADGSGGGGGSGSAVARVGAPNAYRDIEQESRALDALHGVWKEACRTRPDEVAGRS